MNIRKSEAESRGKRRSISRDRRVLNIYSRDMNMFNGKGGKWKDEWQERKKRNQYLERGKGFYYLTI